MSFKTARESFEQAQQVAEASGDSAMEFIAAGLAELARTLSTELNDVDSKIKGVESKVRALR